MRQRRKSYFKGLHFRWPALCIDRLPGSTYGNGGQQLGGGSQPGGDQPEEGGQPEVEDRPETEDPPGDEDPPGGAGEESVTPGTSGMARKC
ncbi:hypothetical protein Y032_0082g1597 [Ancylostoma ceylanicum]|uniref:Uncharacterized protein n=1 Tax=Ancylostoma ceylanicum TaxID=53326 RepID=A0A016TQZ7_9BILA|nr:hypothetical protein Y032_0082g1597 [Ancylostoma ceylanicum]